jgi:hypothetical protein
MTFLAVCARARFAFSRMTRKESAGNNRREIMLIIAAFTWKLEQLGTISIHLSAGIAFFPLEIRA